MLFSCVTTLKKILTKRCDNNDSYIFCWSSFFHACCTSLRWQAACSVASSKTTNSTSAGSGRSQSTSDGNLLPQTLQTEVNWSSVWVWKLTLCLGAAGGPRGSSHSVLSNTCFLLWRLLHLRVQSCWRGWRRSVVQLLFRCLHCRLVRSIYWRLKF